MSNITALKGSERRRRARRWWQVEVVADFMLPLESTIIVTG
jgi:hypothetical protein